MLLSTVEVALIALFVTRETSIFYKSKRKRWRTAIFHVMIAYCSLGRSMCRKTWRLRYMILSFKREKFRKSNVVTIKMETCA